MVIWTAKVTKRSIALALVAAGAVLCGIILLVGVLTNRDVDVASMNLQTKGISDNDSRIAFLTGFGWDVGSEPLESQEVLIPKEWDDVFTQYNDMQKAQGFDLAKHKGKRVMRYTYEIKNYPGGPENVRANILIYKNTVIGGDVESPSLDGFMHGFAKPDAAAPSGN